MSVKTPTIPALSAENVTKVIRDKTILSEVHITLDPGSRVGLVGPNGAGKTTLLKILSGLWRPTEGTVQVFGEKIGLEGPGRQRLGLVFEDARLYPFLTGRDHILATARIHGIDGTEALDLVSGWMDLRTFIEQPVRRMSLGQRQRIALARALVPQPEILLLDEPTNGLDPDGVIELRTLMDTLSRELGVTVLISSHGLLDLSRMIDRVLFVRDGRLVADEPVASGFDALEARWQALFPRSTG